MQTVTVEADMPRRVVPTIMGLAALQPVRSPALAKFLQLPIPCVYSIHRTTSVYVGRLRTLSHGRRRRVQSQALRLLSM
jgi:hypothetical protein